MKLVPQEEYGVRCMMQLALAAPDKPTTVAEVAEREGLSPEYAGKLLYLLRRAGLTNSVRGRKGGFRLTRPAYMISLAEILRVFSNDLFDDDFCQCYPGGEDTCVNIKSCALRPVWWGISRLITRTLEGISLMDLLLTEEEVLQQVMARLEVSPGGGFHQIEVPLAATSPEDPR